MVGILLATRAEAAPLLRKLGAQPIPDGACELYWFKASGQRPAGKVLVTGMGPERAATATDYFLQRHGITHVINAGVCGAITDRATRGEVFRVGAVLDGDAALAAGQAEPCPVRGDLWVDLPAVRLASVKEPVFEEGRRARLGSHADVVDMEGLAVVEACRGHGVPCWVIKGVTDRADRDGKADIQRNISRVSGAVAEQVLAGLPGIRRPGGETVGTAMRFVKIEHSLFSLPLLLAGAWLGAGGHVPSWQVLGLIVVAGVGARTLGMAMNRILDRKLDALNPRTADRALPAGRMSAKAAFGVAAGSLAVFLLACAALGPICLALSPIPAAVLIGYSLLKRFTSLCHFGIGLCLALAPLGAYVAASGSVAVTGPILLLSLFTFCWMSGFDIIYSLMDVESDRRTGVHSLPVALGPKGALAVAGGIHLLSAGAILALWAALGGGLWPGLALAVALAALLAAHVPRIPLPIRFFPISAVAGFAAGMIPLMDKLP